MMSFSDIFKKSFLDGYSTIEMSTTQILVVMAFTTLISIYIFYCYRVMTRRTLYSKNFNIALVALAIITAGVILTIQSSVVVSLGMVGALSIVRFRTAIKDPMDLVFLFWSISVGIICGAGLVEIAILMSLVITLVLFILDKTKVARAPFILVINAAASDEISEKISSVVDEFCKYSKEKSRTLTSTQLDLVMELRVENGEALTTKLSKIEGVNSVALLSHDGEVTF
jgi:uncharacterized membrane protein YhiD involved in acid resistance